MNNDDYDSSSFHNKISSLPDSDILIAKASSSSTIDDSGEFVLQQFYKTELTSATAGEVNYEHFGKWTPLLGIIDERKIKVNSRRRRNLHGKLMTVSYVHLDKRSRNHLSDFVDTQTDSILKTNYIILNAILDNLNATKKELFQSTWGYYNPKTKKWSGMMGDIVHKGADIGGKICIIFVISLLSRKTSRNVLLCNDTGTALFPVADRYPYIEYSAMYTPTHGAFVFRAPQLSTGNRLS